MSNAGEHLEELVVSPDDAYLKSTFYEQLVEHVFVSEVLQEIWYGYGKTAEVLRSEVDASGYDVVFECNGVLRHVQLKTTKPDAKTSRQKVNLALAKKPGGCVVWIVRREDPGTKRMKLTYRFFGGAPGKALPSLESFAIAKHTKGDSTGTKKERPNICVVPKRYFKPVATTRELVELLFGDLHSVDSSSHQPPEAITEIEKDTSDV